MSPLQPLSMAPFQGLAHRVRTSLLACTHTVPSTISTALIALKSNISVLQGSKPARSQPSIIGAFDPESEQWQHLGSHVVYNETPDALFKIDALMVVSASENPDLDQQVQGMTGVVVLNAVFVQFGCRGRHEDGLGMRLRQQTGERHSPQRYA